MQATALHDSLRLGRWTRPALIAGIAAAILAIVGAVLDLGLFMHAYLVAYFFWLAISLGCLAVLMIQNLAGGFWGAVMRRPLEAAAGTLPLLAVLFIPVLLGMPYLYAWLQPGGMGHPALPAFKQFYLSVPFFIARAVIYFAVWIILSRVLVRWSLQRDEHPTPELTARMRGLSAFGLVLMALTVTYAAIDWLMSLDASWSSSIYGLMVVMGALLSGFAFVVFLLTRWAARSPFAAVASPHLFNSLGSLLLAFLMLWAYMAFSQLILIYAGNLPEEITWYLRRVQGGWLFAALFVAVFHFVIPFAFLILRPAKRNRVILGGLCAGLLFAQYVNLYWLVEPTFGGDSPLIALYNMALAVAIGGLWLALFAGQLSRWPVLAPTDPKLVAHMEMAHE